MELALVLLVGCFGVVGLLLIVFGILEYPNTPILMKVVARLGLWPLVWLKKPSGDVVLLVARRSPFGDWYCGFSGLLFSARYELISGGEARSAPDVATGGVRIGQWREWEHNRKHVLFGLERAGADREVAVGRSS